MLHFFFLYEIYFIKTKKIDWQILNNNNNNLLGVICIKLEKDNHIDWYYLLRLKFDCDISLRIKILYSYFLE